MHKNDDHTHREKNVKIIDIMITISIISVNLASIRDVMHFGRSGLVTLCLLDLFFPAVALACGLASRRFLKFTFSLFVFDLAYVLVGAILTMSS
jgi:hypothetical protein